MPDAGWVALSLTGRIGGATFAHLLDAFDHDLSAVLNADAATLQQVPGIGPKISAAIRSIDLRQVEAAVARWQAADVTIVTSRDRDYPAPLRTLADAPPTLFVCGRWHATFDRAVAIVGTRRPTPQSLVVARQLGFLLARQGYTIISGLAYGVDTAAHQGALAAGGTTVAVLGSGVLRVYPRANRALAAHIAGHGALISETHPELAVSAAALVARNRIITGLSAALIVVETAADGGAMYAVRFARQQGRPIYAIDNDAGGNRMLLADGATPLPADLQRLLL